ncbi:MAG TPA: GAP family protein [Acidimicrobiales bacterium]
MLIGLAITLQPLPFVVFILVLSADGGLRKGLAFLVGWLLSLLAVIGAAVALTSGQPLHPNSAPSTAALAAKLAIGVFLIALGAHHRTKIGRPVNEPKWMARLDNISLPMAGGLGVFLQAWPLVFAGAVTVLDAQIANAGEIAALLGFCILASSTLLAVELHAAFSPEEAHRRLESIRPWINRHRDQAIVVISLLLGFWLTGKSIYLLVGG